MGSGAISRYTYWSGLSYEYLYSVVIAISSHLQPLVGMVIPADKRIMVLSLKHAFGFMSLIGVYSTYRYLQTQ